jgi:hypothetical protein
MLNMEEGYLYEELYGVMFEREHSVIHELKITHLRIDSIFQRIVLFGSRAGALGMELFSQLLPVVPFCSLITIRTASLCMSIFLE